MFAILMLLVLCQIHAAANEPKPKGVTMKEGAVMIQCLGPGRLHGQFLTTSGRRVKLSHKRITDWIIVRPEGMYRNKFVLQVGKGNPRAEHFLAWSQVIVPKLKLSKKDYLEIEAIAAGEPDQYYFRLRRNNENYFIAATWPDNIILSVQDKTLFKVTWNSREMTSALSHFNL